MGRLFRRIRKWLKRSGVKFGITPKLQGVPRIRASRSRLTLNADEEAFSSLVAQYVGKFGSTAKAVKCAGISIAISPQVAREWYAKPKIQERVAQLQANPACANVEYFKDESVPHFKYIQGDTSKYLGLERRWADMDSFCAWWDSGECPDIERTRENWERLRAGIKYTVIEPQEWELDKSGRPAMVGIAQEIDIEEVKRRWPTTADKIEEAKAQ